MNGMRLGGRREQWEEYSASISGVFKPGGIFFFIVETRSALLSLHRGIEGAKAAKICG